MCQLKENNMCPVIKNKPTLESMRSLDFLGASYAPYSLKFSVPFHLAPKEILSLTINRIS